MDNNINDSTQLYKKHVYPSGRVKYVPVEKLYDYELIRPGITYVTYKHKGCTSTKAIRYEVTPDYAPILVALYKFEDEAINILQDSNKFIPNRELTPEEQEHWKPLSTSQVVFNGISMYDFIRKLINFLEEKIKEDNYSED